MLRVRLLGELRADIAGRAIAPPASRRAWALLGWLALHPGEHPRGGLAARFWPEVLDASARGSLRNAIWALRRALGPGGEHALVTARDRIGLTCETDLAQFDAHLAGGRLEQAVALCDGPLLADLDEDWVLEARDEHAERVGAALARLAAGADSPAAAVAWARRRLALDPLDEAAARDLMARMAAAGDRTGALSVHDRLAERLRTTLGLAPSAETRALAAQVRAVERTPAAVASLPAAAAAAADDAALVGREPELAALVELWDQVRAGRGALAVLGGEGGIGKTRLAGELVARARAAGARTARCTAADLGGAPPFGPWAELLAGLAAELEPPPADAGWPEELARLAPSLPRRLGRPPAPPADVPPELARARLFEGAVELVEHATADRPLVLLFDDVNLADPPTLELGAYLARRIAGLPVLLLLTRRLAPRRDAVDGLVHAARDRGVAVRELDLEPLGRTEVERLVEAVAPLDAVARERVVAAADGNPLLALECARATARGHDGPPVSLRANVRTAIARLGDPARRAAELIAVAGRDLDRTELAAVAEPGAVLDAMECGLFRSAGGRFGFRHALLREAVYTDLDDTRRLVLHEALGEALTGHAAEAAHHLRLAGRADLAAGRLLEAAVDAARATAFHEAAAYLREVVELRPGDPHARLELAGTLAVLGRRAAAIEAFAAALAQIDPADAAARAAAHMQAARWFRGSLCDPVGAGRSAQAGLDALAARDDADPELRAGLLLVRAWSEATVVGADAAAVTLRELEALGIDLEAPSLLRQDLDSVRGFVLLARGDVEAAEAALARAGETGVLSGRPDMAYGGFANAACVAAAAGRLDAALAHADRGVAIVAGLPVLQFQMAVLRASLLARLGRHAEAREELDRRDELVARLGLPELAAVADHDAGIVAMLAGEYERAQERLGSALAGDTPLPRAEARLRRAEALARLGRPDAADVELRAATLEPVRPADRPAVLVARMTFAQGLSARARGNAALAERRLHEAGEHWRRLAGGGEAAREHLASLVDLGRPPVTGVVDPAYELERVTAELLELEALPT